MKQTMMEQTMVVVMIQMAMNMIFKMKTNMHMMLLVVMMKQTMITYMIQLSEFR